MWQADSRDNLFHITGTDIVRSLTYRFFAFGRPVSNTKKFEEGIFSDLRNLKPGTDASLEEPKSEFLDLLYKNNCIRTQKKQKVFYWFSVPHDRLFLDALERDLKREKMNQEPTTRATAEPALSFYYDSSMTLFDQLTKAVQQSNSSASSLTMNRARDQGMGDYRSHSRQHSRQASDLMPPPAQMSQMPHPHEEYASYIMQENNQLELEPSASIVQRQLESSPFVPMPYGQQSYRSAAMSCPPFAGVEYSPAPSFGTGHISPDEYAQGRAMTYAPETPPQSQQGIYGMSNQAQHYGLLPTPEASISGDVYTPHSIIFLDRSNFRRHEHETSAWSLDHARAHGSPPGLADLQTTTQENKYFPTHEHDRKQHSRHQWAIWS
jgi:transcription factor STE12